MRNGLPKDWKIVKLGEVCEINPKLSNNTIDEELEVSFIPMKRVAEVSGKVDLSETRKYNAVKKGFTPFQNEDVIFAKITPCMENGKVAIVKNLKNDIGFGSTEFFVLRSRGGIANRFLFHYIVRQTFRNEAAHNMTGAVGQKRVPKSFIERSEILLPPLPTQHRIVSKIEELFSELDKGIENLKTAQQQLKTYQQAVLKWAFEGKLTNENVNSELPKGWKWVKIKEIGKIETGTTPSKSNSEFYSSPDYPFFKPTDLEAGINTRVANDNLSKKGIHAGRFLKAGSILVTCIGATIGKTGLIRVDGASNQQINSITPFQEMNSEFVYYQIISSAFQERIKDNAAATTLPILNKSKFEKLDLIVCPLEEQHRIVQEIESRLSVCDKTEETITASLQQAEALRQSILKMAFEGRLVKEEDDEISLHVVKTAIEPETKILSLFPHEEFPRKKTGIAATDLHAGIIAMVIDAHEKHPEHLVKLNNVKVEKIAHLVEYKIGVSLGREPVKDAAGPDDYKHLKKVEHRAAMAGYFDTVPLPKYGFTYKSMRGIHKIITKTKEVLTEKEFTDVSNLIQTFLKFEMEHAEVVATLFAGWNNLLLLGKNPTDDKIVLESRDNWSKRKLGIKEEKFYKTLKWMREHDFIPEGKGKMVVKPEKKPKKRSKR